MSGGGPPSIVVAVDPPDSVPDSLALDTLALATGWPVVLVNAMANGTDRHGLERVERELAGAASRFRQRGIEAEARAVIGPPVDVIVSAAEASRAGYIVVVGRRHHVDGRVSLGSVTSTLLKVVDRPVLVLPAGPGPDQPGFTAAIERLIELLDRLPDDDSGSGENRAELRRAVAAQLPPSSSEADRRRLNRRLLDHLHRFETEHPSLTQAINDVAYFLSGMGI